MYPIIYGGIVSKTSNSVHLNINMRAFEVLFEHRSTSLRTGFHVWIEIFINRLNVIVQSFLQKYVVGNSILGNMFDRESI